MAFLTKEQKDTFGGVINAFGYVLAACVVIALACKYVLSGYPPFIAWLEPFNELIIVTGAVATGIVVYANNKLIKS